MHSKNVLIFDISSEYGHFRKFNTTTSPLTYSVPTRPAIAGLVGAILGIEREISAGKFKEGTVPLADLLAKDKASIGVQILAPIKKTNIAFNLINTKDSFFEIAQRTQIEFELLKNPSFRIFISWNNDKLFDELVERVENNRTHFSPYLGLSQFTCKTDFFGLKKAVLSTNEDFEEVLTAVNLGNVNAQNPIQFNYSKDFKYTSDTMPVQMRSDRIVTEYAEIITEINGQSISVKSNQIYQIEKYGNILFL